MLCGLAGQAIVTQQRLDEEYLSRLHYFENFAPVSGLAAGFVPTRLVLHTQSIDCRFSTGSESLQEIRLVNQVISKRYRAESITHSVHMEVRRSPIGPASSIANKQER
jgi:hypothetical protein